MNNCSIKSTIHWYQNEPTLQQFVSIYNGIGKRTFTIVQVLLV